MAAAAHLREWQYWIPDSIWYKYSCSRTAAEHTVTTRATGAVWECKDTVRMSRNQSARQELICRQPKVNWKLCRAGLGQAGPWWGGINQRNSGRQSQPWAGFNDSMKVAVR